MKRYFLAFLFIGFIMPSFGFSQKQDYRWISGIKSNPNNPPTRYANMLSFLDDTIEITKAVLPIYMRRTPITISDEDGELLFYTNGNVVVNKYHKIMENGKGFNEGSDWSDFDTDLTWNNPYFDFCFMVYPDRDSSSIYYMIHSLINYHDEDFNYLSKSDYIQISKINTEANEGQGKVIYKNKILLNKTTSPKFIMTKHANGKDWWIILKNLDASEYTLLLMQKDLILQEITVPVETFSTFEFVRIDSITANLNVSSISHQGDIIQDNYGEQIVRLFDFDRCSGLMTLRDTFHTTRDTLFQDGRPHLWGSGVNNVCFSPSGQYMYSWSLHSIDRYDLYTASLSQGKEEVGGTQWALFDDFSRSTSATILPPLTLGPDGKIYILQQYTHRIIENPDDPYDSDYCEAPCIDFSNVNTSNPELYSNNYPNYRLGPLENSSCDTIVSSIEEKGIQQHLKIYPNPASNQLRIEIDLADWQNKDVQLYIYDILGREIYHHQMTPFSYLHDIEVSSWPMGIYHTHLIKDQITLQVQKIVVQK